MATVLGMLLHSSSPKTIPYTISFYVVGVDKSCWPEVMRRFGRHWLRSSNRNHVWIPVNKSEGLDPPFTIPVLVCAWNPPLDAPRIECLRVTIPKLRVEGHGPRSRIDVQENIVHNSTSPAEPPSTLDRNWFRPTHSRLSRPSRRDHSKT